MSTLVVAAHPDDEVLGAGATVARAASAGEDVFVAILGEGITSRYPNRADAEGQLLEDLRHASEEASKILGVKGLACFELPDNRFDTIPLLDVVHLVEELVDRYQPTTIYTHHGGDLNIDHVVVHRAVLIATRPQPGAVRRIYAFEIPSSTEWAFGKLAKPFEPTVFVDVAETLPAKLRAMAAYESEARAFPHPRSPEALTALAQVRGAAAGFAAAEAFELVREIV